MCLSIYNKREVNNTDISPGISSSSEDMDKPLQKISISNIYHLNKSNVNNTYMSSGVSSNSYRFVNY